MQPLTRSPAPRALRAAAVRLAALRAAVVGLLAAVALTLVPPTASATGIGLPGLDAGPEPSATASAPDARLRAGCRDYVVRYQVQDAGEDWLLTLDILDRRGRGVAHLNLHGVKDPRKGRTTFSVCRSAVKAGRFTVTGVLADRDGWAQTEHPVDGGRFWLRRR